MKFATWIETFVEEKGIDPDLDLEIEGPSGHVNYVPVHCLVEAMQLAPAAEQKAIKAKLIEMDFRGADPVPFFRHLARAIAI